MIVVSDTGPLNYLLLTQRVELLNQIFGTVVIPPAVVEELTDQGASPIVRDWANHPPEWVQVQEPANVPKSSRTDGRGKGERVAIALAKELNAPLLSDDRQARHIARVKGLLVSGTLGVLQEAHAQKLDDIDRALDDLLKTNYFLSEGLIERTSSAAHAMRIERDQAQDLNR